MTFDIDWRIMLDYYYQTEKQFIELSRIIPLDNADSTYSPNLYNILQMSCSQLVNLMRILSDKLLLKREGNNFPTLYKILNIKQVLEKQKVAVLTNGGGGLIPFIIKDTKAVSPIWWSEYNDTKHNLPDGFRSGNIGNTINALGGLYSLHCICYYAEHIPVDDLLDSEKWDEEDVIVFHQSNDIARLAIDYRPKSELFYGLTFYGKGARI